MSDRRLADAHLAEVEAEQAALRRIAALLARSVPAEEVFDAVVGEVVRSCASRVSLVRYEADETGTYLAVSAEAEASHIDVTVELRDGRLWISVRDDGVGGADPACGSGLVGLKDRIEAFGGTMTLESPTGGGTTLVAQFPLPEHPALEAQPANA